MNPFRRRAADPDPAARIAQLRQDLTDAQAPAVYWRDRAAAAEALLAHERRMAATLTGLLTDRPAAGTSPTPGGGAPAH